MIGEAMYSTIITLDRQGISQRQISRMTNTHRKTVKKIIMKYRKYGITSPEPYKRESELDKWHEAIVEQMTSNLSMIRMHEKLKDQGFTHSYESLSRYIRKHKIKSTTCIRFHSEPGEEAQVDFGDIGRRYDQHGKLRKAYVFNMRLSYSRRDYYEIVFDQKVETWLKCHINAFNFFGGVPQVIKIDNLKSGVTDANFYEPIFQKEYLRLAENYGCWVSPCSGSLP